MMCPVAEVELYISFFAPLLYHLRLCLAQNSFITLFTFSFKVDGCLTASLHDGVKSH